MANIKFSGFTEVTSISGVQEIVGYNGTQNVRITPANLVNTVLPGGPFLPLTGGIMTGDIQLLDNVELKIGTGNDLNIRHSGTQSFIQNQTGNLTIQNLTDDGDIVFQSDDGSGGTAIYFMLDGSETRISTKKNNRFDDNVRAEFGTSGDLDIYHNGTDSYIGNDTGNLYIQQLSDDKDIIFQSDDGAGGVETYFYLDGSAGGPSPFTVFPDSSTLTFGTGYDLRQYHNGTDSYLDNYEGNLTLRNLADDKDIIFQSDDGSGGVENYIQIDGSEGRTTFNKTIRLNDAVVLQIGSSADLQLFHESDNSYISNSIGDLTIRNLANDKDIIFQSDDGAGGVTTYFQLDGASGYNKAFKDILYLDNIKARFGNSNDLEIYHDGSNSYISDTGTGSLKLTSSDIIMQTTGGNALIAEANQGVKLYYNAVKKFETTNNGVTVSGDGLFTNTASLETKLSGNDSALNFTTASGDVYRIGVKDSDDSFRISKDGTSLATNTRLTIDTLGAIQFNNYGAGTFTGTLAKTLGVTSAGDVIEYVPPVSVIGNNSIYVAPVGTLAENGAALLAGYTAAVAKIGSDSQPGGFLSLFLLFAPGALGNANWLGFANSPILFAPGPVYQAPWGSPSGTQVLIQVTLVGGFAATSFQFTITNLDGSPFTPTGLSFSEPELSVPVPSSLIIAPGSYEIASDLVINELVSVTSLTGQPDVIITGGNVQVKAGANNSSYRIAVTGLYTKMSIFTETLLTSVQFKNCIGEGANSFGVDPATGTGTNSGVYIECVGGEKSFGGGIGNTAAGVYTRCIAFGDYGFGGLGETSGSFMNCGSRDASSFIFPPYDDGGNPWNFNGLFGGEGTKCAGFFDGCIGVQRSFGSFNTNTITASFRNCSSGNDSFGCGSTGNSGQYFNCTVRNNNNNTGGGGGAGGWRGFGCDPTGGDTALNANYINCSADVIARNANIGSKFINCHATPSASLSTTSDWSGYNCGDQGLAYNCSFGSPKTAGGVLQPTQSGTGKIRNCLSGGASQYTIVNLG
tara:strand:- start:2493 stop:5561 length:3069 start_codon:yes stop_codon:yes gene_type:complete